MFLFNSDPIKNAGRGALEPDSFEVGQLSLTPII